MTTPHENSLIPRRLRLIQKGYERYTGPIGAYEFVDGLSVDAIPRVDRDRLATAFQFNEIEEDGGEVEAGIAARMLRDAPIRAETGPGLEVQTAEEKLLELRAGIEKAFGEKSRKTHTRAELEKILEKKGIPDLRAIGDQWGVKARSALALIDAILAEQERWTAKFDGQKARAVAETEALVPAAPAEPAADTVQAAAVSGDLSAAITLEQLKAGGESLAEIPGSTIPDTSEKAAE